MAQLERDAVHCMDSRMDQALVLGGRVSPFQTSEQGLTHRLNRTRLDWKMDFQVLNLEDRGVRHAKSLPK